MWESVGECELLPLDRASAYPPVQLLISLSELSSGSLLYAERRSYRRGGSERQSVAPAVPPSRSADVFDIQSATRGLNDVDVHIAGREPLWLAVVIDDRVAERVVTDVIVGRGVYDRIGIVCVYADRSVRRLTQED
jgi:hypothetical protein